jgi:hypothetical protein
MRKSVEEFLQNIETVEPAKREPFHRKILFVPFEPEFIEPAKKCLPSPITLLKRLFKRNNSKGTNLPEERDLTQ